jgi:AraC-like DNA-binding protein
MVADRFQISQSSITRIFRKYNQTGFLEFLHYLRVTEAIRLLRETTLTETEIAPLTGYNNVITMIRAFKTYAHTTPSAIRAAVHRRP